MAVGAAVGMLAAYGAAQNHVTKPYKRFTVSQIRTLDTSSYVPQVGMSQGLFNPNEAAENDYTPPLPPDRPTAKLTAGSMSSVPRGAVNAFFPGPTDLRWFPPDCNMAVGPDHIVTVINSTIAFYTKTGTKTFQQQMDTSGGFFDGTRQTGFVFDPKCFYDPISNRFFVVALDLDEGSTISNALVAVSDDSNPNGVWRFYRINAILNQGGTNYWLDYPGFGFNKDAVVITGNMFGIGGGYFGVQALVLPKAPMLTGGAVTASVLLDPGIGTLQPTRTADPNSDKIFGVATGGGNSMRFYAFTNLTTVPLLTEVNVAVPTYGGPGGPAPSGSNVIDALDGRVMTAFYRSNQVVAAHTVSASGNPHVVRWYDFNTANWPTAGAPTLKQSGNISSAGQAMHMPAINMNSFEDISVIYTRSSSSIGSDLCISSRFKDDPLGQIGAPVKLIGSTTANYTAFRWGDYFGCEVDPADDTSFWGFGMIVAPSGAYQTHIVRWEVTPPNGASGTVIPPNTISTFVGNYLFGDVTTVTNSDDIYYQIGSTQYGTVGQAAGADLAFTVPTNTTVMTAELEAVAGLAGGTSNVWLFNWTTNAYDLIGSAPLPASGDTKSTFSVPLANVSKYIGAGGSVLAKVRGHFPQRPFGPPPPIFTYKIDQFHLVVR